MCNIYLYIYIALTAPKMLKNADLGAFNGKNMYPLRFCIRTVGFMCISRAHLHCALGNSPVTTITVSLASKLKGTKWTFQVCSLFSPKIQVVEKNLTCKIQDTAKKIECSTQKKKMKNN